MKEINRRDFLKVFGLGGVATLVLGACAKKEDPNAARIGAIETAIAQQGKQLDQAVDLIGIQESHQPEPTQTSSESNVVVDNPAGATAEEVANNLNSDQCEGDWVPVQEGEVHRPVGEPNAFAFTREKDLNGDIIPACVEQDTGCLQDGWMHIRSDRDAYGRTEPVTALGSGIPSGKPVLVDGITLRPCE